MKHEKKSHKKAGGSIAQSGPHEEQTNAKKTEKMMHPDVETQKDEGHQKMKVEKKKGGSVKHKRPERKHGGMVPGKKPHANLGKRARGGSAKSPLSGADAPNLGYAHGDLGIDQGGKGKDKK